ncbi:MAG: ParB/RepB/Spo0J family partition protein [Alphaproteobacteria bacterium]|nr:ParB/RepB/Spo0J family partition protein [Alphaproteobacteria bacterium]
MGSSLKTIPLRNLTRSKANVRKTYPTAAIEELAASILAHGLLENLVVAPLASKRGSKTKRFGVAAGGRRLAALQLLAKRRKIKRTYPVACQIRSSSDDALGELSLAENVERVSLHPADQFEAFAKLQAQGHSAGEIGSRFGVTDTFVVQRLKLAAVSPKLLGLYRKDEMTLEQLMAFTVSDDQAAQEEVWFGLPYKDPAPDLIRQYLTRSQVHGRDRRALFIGPKAYEAAGGEIVRDLFQEEGEGYFKDSQLLDRLVAAKLDGEAQAIKGEGWSWVEVATELDYERLARFGRAKATEQALPAKEEKRVKSLSKRYDDLVSALEDQEDPKAEAELAQVSGELDTLLAKKTVWSEREKQRSGALIGIDQDGQLKVVRGLIRPEERKRSERQDERPKSAQQSGGYSDTLLADLTAHRSAALRELLADNPQASLTALLKVLVERMLLREGRLTCVGITPTEAVLEAHAKSLGESKASAAFLKRHAGWQERIPTREGLWDWLSGLKQADRLALLAHCVSMTVDAVARRAGSEERLRDSETLAQALSLDMADWWRPTTANFLGAVTKEQIVSAVSEALSPQETQRLSALKKAEMAERAEQLLANTRWLPEPLRPNAALPGAEDADLKQAAE